MTYFVTWYDGIERKVEKSTPEDAAAVVLQLLKDGREGIVCSAVQRQV